MKHTQTEENYLKAIYHFAEQEELVSTNSIANYLGTSPASVTDMLKKLSDKRLVDYIPYKGVSLTKEGEAVALRVIRKHRLWEVFLVEKLNFSWDNVHEVAEQLEHIDSPELIKQLDKFLNYPKFDPHGDPIPTESGEIVTRETHLLSTVEPNQEVLVVGVAMTQTEFLQYLDKLGLTIGQRLTVLEKLPFDDSMQLELDGGRMIVSGNVSRNILVLKD